MLNGLSVGDKMCANVWIITDGYVPDLLLIPTPEGPLMSIRTCMLALCLSLSLGARAAELATAPSEDLHKIYAQLRSLHGSTQGAVTENVVWRRDAATFTFHDGHLT